LGTVGDAVRQKTDNPHMRLLNDILQALRHKPVRLVGFFEKKTLLNG
jgi:hypothetical protein